MNTGYAACIHHVSYIPGFRSIP